MTVHGQSLPAGACDTHMHFYDSSYPVAAVSIVRAGDAGVADYRSLQSDLGLERLVVVQPTAYGLDNSCQLDAMADFGEAARGVAVVDASVDGAELARLTGLGVRGARFHLLPGGSVPWEHLEPVAAGIAEHGWHVQLQLNGRELVDRRSLLEGLPTSLVIDHVGRFMPPVHRDSAAFEVLLELIDAGRTWVKLSAPYESSELGPPRFDDVDPLIRALVGHAPERLLWGSNWPHPGQAHPLSSDDLSRLLFDWLPSAKLRQQVLVDNPAVVYGFDQPDPSTSEESP